MPEPRSEVGKWTRYGITDNVSGDISERAKADLALAGKQLSRETIHQANWQEIAWAVLALCSTILPLSVRKQHGRFRITYINNYRKSDSVGKTTPVFHVYEIRWAADAYLKLPNDVEMALSNTRVAPSFVISTKRSLCPQPLLSFSSINIGRCRSL